MDEMVRQAMIKWPQVPACWGWLGLDARGQWRMRDAQAQAAGTFQGHHAQARGDVVVHSGLAAFISRNYSRDAAGQWYFQNGPQRVYVELALAPWICRVQPDGAVLTHTGQAVQVQRALLDEMGHLYFVTPVGLGLVHSQDVGAAADWLEQRGMEAADCVSAQLPANHGHVLSPSAVQAQRLPHDKAD